MRFSLVIGLIAISLGLGGCGGGEDAEINPPAPPPAAPDVATTVVASPAPTPAASAPPTGTAPAAMEPAAPDLFTTYKVSADGSPNKSDVEAMQAIVDAYAFGPDGLGAPPLNSLDDLVTKGYLKRLPPAPQGMKWAYDSPKWKVSLVPQ